MRCGWIVGACVWVLGGSVGAVSACAGDCDGGGDVTVDEVLTLVNVALGAVVVEACAAGDSNQDGDITVDEILTAVNHALAGCVATNTETWIESDFALVSSTCPTVVTDAIAEEIAGESACAVEVTIVGERIDTRDCDGVTVTGVIDGDGIARFSTATAEEVEGCLISIDLELRVGFAASPTTGRYLAAVDLTGTCPFGGCAVAIESTLTRE